MAKPEEFTITIGPDGRIQLDFRGMEVESYRRIVEVLRETVGPIEEAQVEAREIPPPTVSALGSARGAAQSAPANLEVGAKKP